MVGQPATDLEISEAYDAEHDILFFKENGRGTVFTMEPGCFAIFPPHDAHMPCVLDAIPETVKKVIVKVWA